MENQNHLPQIEGKIKMMKQSNRFHFDQTLLCALGDKDPLPLCSRQGFPNGRLVVKTASIKLNLNLSLWYNQGD